MEKIDRHSNDALGKDQTLTRAVNLSLIMRAYMKQSMSKVDISRYFGLSKPTSAKIITELESFGFICAAPDHELRSAPGVKPLKYELNRKFGFIAILDMSSVEACIQICDFGGKILSEKRIANKEVITYEDIESFCTQLDEMCEGLANFKSQLLALCVAAPCAVNKRMGTVEWSSRFDIDRDFNLYAYLSNHYPGCAILIENDVQLMLSGEIYSGLLSDGSIPYALLIYVDAGLGGSFFLNGKPESGEEGKAGDLGFLPHLDRNGESCYLDSVISVTAMRRALQQEIAQGADSCLKDIETIHFTHIRDAYFRHDALTVQVVEETALETAKALKSVLEILNINFVIVSGRVVQLGENYLNIIESYLKKHFPKISVKYSEIQDSAIHEGAIFVASDVIINDVISKRKKKAQ